MSTTKRPTHDRHDYEWGARPLTADHPRETAAMVEARIRACERASVRWLAEAPWRGGKGLAAAIATARRTHTESIARERAAARSAA